MTKDETIESYKKQIQSLRQKLNTSEVRKEFLSDELIKVRNEYNSFVDKCVADFDCKPPQLKSKIKTLQTEIDNSLKEAEELLEKIEKGDSDDVS